VKRREFITLFGGALAWPMAARAQQPAMPVVGFINPGSPDALTFILRAFRQGLKDAGYVEGENVAVEYRWGENQIERLPELTADLVRRQVAVIAAPITAVLAAKAVTTTIPIVFVSGEDPVRLGLVASLARPGGNMTGVNIFANELVAKRLELLRELVPGAARVALLVNPTNPATADTTSREVQAAARDIGLQVQVLNASTGREIDVAFATISSRDRLDALFVAGDPLFTNRRVQLVLLTTRHALPTTYAGRQFPEIGGLMSYGASLTDAWRQVGVYSGRILKGAKPAELPVVQSTKFELVINAQAARVLGLEMSPSLLARADEVIE
jgi:putative tryptophan/tyrosine transport system substrate-binding protein